MAQAHNTLQSILDNDLYKFSMQNAVIKHYKRDIPVVYQFTNREKNQRLNTQAVEWLQKQINDMEYLKLTEDERKYLSRLPYFDATYINYLSEFHFNPKEQVKIRFKEATLDFELEIIGKWHETILYEVPILALISEAYYRFTDRDWDYDGQAEKAAQKTKELMKHGCEFSEFGTRRRRDFKTQDIVVKNIFTTYEQYKNELKGSCVGTSNVYFAMKYNATPIGTVAHEFFMATSALEGVRHANKEALNIWYQVYKEELNIALSDTFTTPVFLQDFDHEIAIKYAGVRQDSGDPSAFIDMVVPHYKKLGIDPSTKKIVFSDSLNVERAIDLQKKAAKAGIKAGFGIGTSLTNDFQKASDENIKSKALSIVIKLRECDGKRVIKLSDNPLKHSADEVTISAFKRELEIL